jgi:hypothetical protein
VTVTSLEDILVQPPFKSAAGSVRLWPPFAGDVLVAAASFKSIAEYKRLRFPLLMKSL